ncbi:MAG: DUF1525 domain-containing protein [Gammaproteobacteria bacterium]|nr:DUF1525 domain-containing protein [Gammaproteobacteria bacterium]
MYIGKNLQKSMLFVSLIMLSIVGYAKSHLYVEIFTDSMHPVNISYISGATVKLNYYRLDSANEFVSAINTQLKSLQTEGVSKDKVLQQARQHFLGNTAQLKKAYMGRFLAAKYRLKKYPAIVFEHGKAVVYGETNFSRAISEYEKWQH